MCGAVDFGCYAREATENALETLGRKILEAVGTVVKGALTWWVDPSLDPSQSAAVGHIRAWVLPIAVAVAVGGFMWQAARLAWLRSADPAMELGRGTATLLVASAVSLTLPTLLLKGGDAFSTWVLNQSTGGMFSLRMTALFSASIPIGQLGLAILLGIVAFFAGLVQWVLLFFREGGLVILVGMAQLAAAGAYTRATRGWLEKCLSWLLAVIVWKPVAALVYATAFVLIGAGRSTADLVMGLAMMILAILVLPLLIKVFNITSSSPGGGGGMVGMLAAAGAGAQLMAAGRAGGGAAGGAAAPANAGEYAAMVGAAGGPPGGGPGGSGGSAGPGGPPPALGPAASGQGPGGGGGDPGPGAGSGSGAGAGGWVPPARGSGPAPGSGGSGAGAGTGPAAGVGAGMAAGAGGAGAGATGAAAAGPAATGAQMATGAAAAAAQGAAGAFGGEGNAPASSEGSGPTGAKDA